MAQSDVTSWKKINTDSMHLSSHAKHEGKEEKVAEEPRAISSIFHERMTGVATENETWIMSFVKQLSKLSQFLFASIAFAFLVARCALVPKKDKLLGHF